MCLTLGSVPTNIDSERYFVVIYSQLMTELAQLWRKGISKAQCPQACSCSVPEFFLPLAKAELPQTSILP